MCYFFRSTVITETDVQGSVKVTKLLRSYVKNGKFAFTQKGNGEIFFCNLDVIQWFCVLLSQIFPSTLHYGYPMIWEEAVTIGDSPMNKDLNLCSIETLFSLPFIKSSLNWDASSFRNKEMVAGRLNFSSNFLKYHTLFQIDFFTAFVSFELSQFYSFLRKVELKRSFITLT